MDLSPNEVILLEEYLGRGYAHFTEQGLMAVAEIKRLEEVSLDGRYTGKAQSGGIGWIRRIGLGDRVILFWNTYNSVDLNPLVRGVEYHLLKRPSIGT